MNQITLSFLLFGAQAVALRFLDVPTVTREDVLRPPPPLHIDNVADAPGVVKGAHPSFVILGTGKGGTSDFHSTVLHTYHDLFNPPTAKEVSMLLAGSGIYFVDGRRVTEFDRSKYMSLLGAAGPLPFTIDATPQYIHYPDLVSANLVNATRESVGMLMLRHPVSRARSLYNGCQSVYRPLGRPERYLLQNGTIWTFEEAATWELDLYEVRGAADLEILNTAADWRERTAAFQRLSDLYYRAAQAEIPLMSVLPKQILLNGVYAQNLEAFVELGAFQPGRLLVVQSEDYFQRPEEYLSTIIGPFLFGRDRPELWAGGPRGWRLQRSSVPYDSVSAMSPKLACRLQLFYDPSLQRLLKVLQLPSVVATAYVSPPIQTEGTWFRHDDYCQPR